MGSQLVRTSTLALGLHALLWTMESRCTQCSQLLAAAQKAAINHVGLLSKLQLAKLSRNHEEVASLTTLVTEAVAARRQSLLRYQRHCDSHLSSVDATQRRVLT